MSASIGALGREKRWRVNAGTRELACASASSREERRPRGSSRARREIDTMTDVGAEPCCPLRRAAARGSRRTGRRSSDLRAASLAPASVRPRGRTDRAGIGRCDRQGRDDDVRRRHVAGRESGIVLRDPPDHASAANAGPGEGREPHRTVGRTHTARCRGHRAPTPRPPRGGLEVGLPRRCQPKPDGDRPPRPCHGASRARGEELTQDETWWWCRPRHRG